ncbi:hypothetical protein [Homoserinibacter gongjuensis]|nr:hypothetical protein [Homoserinibacter gongjuensis]
MENGFHHCSSCLAAFFAGASSFALGCCDEDDGVVVPVFFFAGLS